jgi:hypothetical protein
VTGIVGWISRQWCRCNGMVKLAGEGGGVAGCGGRKRWRIDRHCWMERQTVV